MHGEGRIDWNDVATAAKQMAGNWRTFQCFAWHRGHDIEDADQWAIFYTSGRDAGLLDQSNHEEIAKRLTPFTEGDDPDVVAESHSHWAVGYLDGFSIRVYRLNRSVTPAFEEWCRIKEALENYLILNEADYSEREYDATLENYQSEMWPYRGELPEGWAPEVFAWFSDQGDHRYVENRDDQGGYAPREKIIEALQALGLLPAVVVDG